MKNKWAVVNPNIPSAYRPVPHCERISVPKPPKEFTIDSEHEDEGESTSCSGAVQKQSRVTRLKT